MSGGTTGLVVLAMEVGVFRDVHASMPSDGISERVGDEDSADLGGCEEVRAVTSVEGPSAVEVSAKAGSFGATVALKGRAPPLGRQSRETIS